MSSQMPCQGSAGLSGEIRYLFWSEELQKGETGKASGKAEQEKKGFLKKHQFGPMPASQTRNRTVILIRGDLLNWFEQLWIKK